MPYRPGIRSAGFTVTILLETRLMSRFHVFALFAVFALVWLIGSSPAKAQQCGVNGQCGASSRPPVAFYEPQYRTYTVQRYQTRNWHGLTDAQEAYNVRTTGRYYGRGFHPFRAIGRGLFRGGGCGG